MMFLQRYNPCGKTKREQLQSWNILSFNPKTTDVDEHIDLINTLGDMVDQKEEAKKEKFIETMPSMTQTHLIMCKDWATVKDTVKSLEHIIMKCDPPTPAMPTMARGVTVPGLYSHIVHLVDKEEGEIPQPFKGAKPKQTRGRGKPKGKPQEQRQNPPKSQEADKTYTYENPNKHYYNAPSQNRGHRPYNGQGRNRQFQWFIQRNRGQRPQYSQHQFQNYCYQRGTPQQNHTQYGNGRKPYFQENHANTYRGQGHGRGPQQFRGRGHGRANYQNNNGTYQYQYYTHDPQSDQYGPPCSLCSGFNHSPKHCYKGEHDINNIMESLQIESEGCDNSQNTLYSHQINPAKESDDSEKLFYIYQHFQDSETIHQIEPESDLSTTDDDSFYPYINNDIEYRLFEDIVDSYYLDSQIKDDFQCNQDCYSQHRDPTNDDHPNICTNDYHHIMQNI